MATPISTIRDRLFAMGAAALILVLAATTDTVSGFDRWIYDAGQRLTERTPSTEVAVVALDDASLVRVGRWPWPRNLQARLIDQLSLGGARVIVNTLPLEEPEDARGLDEIRRLARITESDLALGNHPALNDQLRRSAAALDTDTQLAQAIARSQRVILTAEVLPAKAPRPSAPANVLVAHTWPDAFTTLPTAKDFRWPLTPMLKGAAGAGHDVMRWDRDEVVRTHDLVLDANGRVVPSVVLAATSAYRGLRASAQRLSVTPEQLTLGATPVATDGPGRLRPQFYPTLAAGRTNSLQVPLHEVLSGSLPASTFKDKIVYIGAVTPAVGPAVYQAVDTPVQKAMPQVVALAHMTVSMLRGHDIRHPWWVYVINAGVSALVLVLLWWGLPRWTAVPRTLSTVALSVVPLAVAHVALTRHGLWIPVALPVMMVLAGYLAIAIFHLLRRAAGHVQTVQRHDAALALSLQGLADQLEDQGHTAAAAAVALHAAQLRPKDALLEARASELQRQATQPAPLDLGSSTLGRYLLDDELGRGAMGAVYSAHDPRIGRTVAIKTMALGSEFEGEALRVARERFFNEAETVGRLQHPDIVTIFDVGEERGLAYIAMEMLRGRDLAEYVHASTRLPVPQVLRIVARVADALAYAHSQGVVHRDVKPANVVVDLQRDLVKVTDFGIARITGSGTTRSGALIGTPTFMSPEQLAGQDVDGRSDLYSLGVTLFQLLTGVLPFRSENMSEFTQAVMNQRAPDVRSLRPELPESLANIVALALEKRPETRYATGRQMAEDLRAVAHLIEIEGLPAVIHGSDTDDVDVVLRTSLPTQPLEPDRTS